MVWLFMCLGFDLNDVSVLFCSSTVVFVVFLLCFVVLVFFNCHFGVCSDFTILQQQTTTTQQQTITKQQQTITTNNKQQ